MNLLDRTSAGDLLARCSYAILFSEEDATCKKLSALSALLMEFRSSPASTNVLEKLKVAEYEAVEAMRQELLQLREPRHQQPNYRFFHFSSSLTHSSAGQHEQS